MTNKRRLISIFLSVFEINSFFVDINLLDACNKASLRLKIRTINNSSHPWFWKKYNVTHYFWQQIPLGSILCTSSTFTLNALSILCTSEYFIHFSRKLTPDRWLTLTRTQGEIRRTSFPLVTKMATVNGIYFFPCHSYFSIE